MSTYIVHHGIKGQRWGIRRYQNEDGSLTPEGKKKYGDKFDNAKEYTDDQYRRDIYVYGKRGANRINKSTLKGEQVSGARSKEANRIESTRNAAKILGAIGGVAGAIGGTLGAYMIGKNHIKSTGNKTADSIIGGALLTGGATVGGLIGKHGTRAATMAIGGYSPSKY